MKLIKLALISGLGLFILVTIISSFIPSTVRISRAINVAGEPGQVLLPVRDLKSWPQWYPGLSSVAASDVQVMEENGKMTMSIPNSKVILQKENDQQVLADLVGAKGKIIHNGFNAITHQASDSITLQWYMDFKLKWYPWEKFASMLYEKMYGATMEVGLGNLKQIIDSSHSSQRIFQPRENRNFQ